MTDDDLTAAQIRERVTWLQEQRRIGAEALRAKAAFKKPVDLTDAESAAIARKKLDARGGTP